MAAASSAAAAASSARRGAAVTCRKAARQARDHTYATLDAGPGWADGRAACDFRETFAGRGGAHGVCQHVWPCSMCAASMVAGAGCWLLVAGCWCRCFVSLTASMASSTSTTSSMSTPCAWPTRTHCSTPMHVARLRRPVAAKAMRRAPALSGSRLASRLASACSSPASAARKCLLEHSENRAVSVPGYPESLAQLMKAAQRAVGRRGACARLPSW